LARLNSSAIGGFADLLTVETACANE